MLDFLFCSYQNFAFLRTKDWPKHHDQGWPKNSDCDISSLSISLPIIKSKLWSKYSLFVNKICRKIKLKKRTAAHMKQFHLEVFLDSTLKLWIYSSESYRCISVCLLSSVSNWKSQLKTIISMILNCYSCIWSPYCSIEIKAGAEVTISFRRKPDDILFSRKFFS